MNYDRFFGAGHLPPRPLREDEAAGGRKAVRLHFTVYVALHYVALRHLTFACHLHAIDVVTLTLRSHYAHIALRLHHIYATFTLHSHGARITLTSCCIARLLSAGKRPDFSDHVKVEKASA